jgi:tRNA-dihydrouridine synthase 2
MPKKGLFVIGRMANLRLYLSQRFCLRKFSVQGGMGAALLTNYETAVDIVKTLRRNLDIPVSVKIRLKDDTPQTLHLMKALEMAGACAIAVHMR